MAARVTSGARHPTRFSRRFARFLQAQTRSLKWSPGLLSLRVLRRQG